MLTSVYEAVTFSKQEKCSEKKMNYQQIWFNYSVILMNIFLVSIITRIITKVNSDVTIIIRLSPLLF